MTEEPLPPSELANLVDSLLTPLPYSNATLVLFLDTIAFTIASLDPSVRADLMPGLLDRFRARQKDSAGVVSCEEISGLEAYLVRAVTTYEHYYAQARGHSYPLCSLSPPCHFHV